MRKRHLIPAIPVLLSALLTYTARPQPIFHAGVRIVEVPVTVTGADGKMLRGLKPDDFRLLDNDRPQRFHLDEAGQSFSLAIAIQTNAAVRAWLPEVSRSASAIEALVLGSDGEGAILTFADDVTLAQSLTADVPHLDHAFRSLAAEGDKSRCIDAVLKATEILRNVPAGKRRVLVLIAQPGDAGSKTQLHDVIAQVERENITVYCLAMPRVGKDLLGNVRISGLGSQGGRDTGFIVSANLTKLVPEIYRGTKAAAGEDAAAVLSTYTGGTVLPFRKRNDLDAAISSIGEQLHTGYVLTYTPNDPMTGYHRIVVTTTRTGATLRARPGYYVTLP